MAQLLPKAHDLSHLVDSRIGNPDADVNTDVFDSFDLSNDSHWFDAGAITGSTQNTMTLTGIGGRATANNSPHSMVGGKTYLIKYDFSMTNQLMLVDLYAVDGLQATSPREQMINSTLGDKSGWVIYTCPYTVGGFYVRQGASEAGVLTINTLEVTEWDGEEVKPEVTNITEGSAADVTVTTDGKDVSVSMVDNSGSEGFRPSWQWPLHETILIGERVKISVTLEVVSGTVLLYGCGFGSTERTSVSNIGTTLSPGIYHITGEYATGVGGDSLIFWIDGADDNFVANITGASLKKVTGLVAAYNMIPSPEGVLVDISGNGNNGTVNFGVTTENGMLWHYNGTDGVNITSKNLGKTHTIAFRAKLTSAAGTTFIPFSGIGVANYIWLSLTNFRYRADSSAVFSVLFNNTYDEESTFMISREGTVLSFYQDGVLLGNDTISTNEDFIWDCFGSTGVYFGTQLQDLRIFNYAFSEKEAQEYHSSFQKIEKRGNFTADFGVGDAIG